MTTESTVASIPDYTGSDANLKEIIAAIKTIINTREGLYGNADDAYLTPRKCKTKTVQFLNVLVQNGFTGWVDDGANFRITVEYGIITNVGASVAAGYGS